MKHDTILTTKKSKKCRFPGCDCVGKKRGNCRKHYQKHLRAVNAGTTTWDELVDIGLVAPAAPGQRNDDYQKTLDRARAKAGAK